ncbi:hypothetical protein TRAPUB_8800 [Trametes pubescens]|uniref:Uncharacterized protein n=1 Tax=Trametes pubescens TaxID=154538 RepID=A0A1M2W4F0_TRAPU|nr:hypothetical protein TRAPUB_8800 [Trametes pubescens]
MTQLIFASLYGTSGASLAVTHPSAPRSSSQQAISSTLKGRNVAEMREDNLLDLSSGSMGRRADAPAQGACVARVGV